MTAAASRASPAGAGACGGRLKLGGRVEAVCDGLLQVGQRLGVDLAGVSVSEVSRLPAGRAAQRQLFSVRQLQRDGACCACLQPVSRKNSFTLENLATNALG